MIPGAPVAVLVVAEVEETAEEVVDARSVELSFFERNVTPA